jgi:hypothetical protein
MIPVTPKSLYDLCTRDHLRGVLVSGGFTMEGQVPLTPFLPTIKKIKEKRDILINVHTGLVTDAGAKMLRKTGIDCVSFDFVIDRGILNNVYGLQKDPEDFIRSMRILSQYLDVAPHLCIGLNWGKVEKELDALKILAGMRIKKLVLLILKPTPGTPMADVHVSHDDIFTVFEEASQFDSISLGCMRPRDQEIEKKADKLGFDIAKPSFIKGESRPLCCVF